LRRRCNTAPRRTKRGLRPALFYWAAGFRPDPTVSNLGDPGNDSAPFGNDSGGLGNDIGEVGMRISTLTREPVRFGNHRDTHGNDTNSLGSAKRQRWMGSAAGLEYSPSHYGLKSR
jgi:hypothetical protein